ncbi:dockerin type I repeat-containing protein, partial [Candidatus Marinimicrobia bacterium]|nr:dockerin type I repeat-containing protein [Candidatus Neomarinimicrobiota bacterium]
TSGLIVDYFDITPFNGPHSFTIQDAEGNLVDFVVWPTSSEYQNGFDITSTDLNVLTQQPFGVYEVQITGELGAYCDDDEQLDISSEWQITVEYESDIVVDGSVGECVADGDVTGDGTINVLDVISTVNHILGNATLEDDGFCSADFNDDGIINVTDIISLINMILGN